MRKLAYLSSLRRLPKQVFKLAIATFPSRTAYRLRILKGPSFRERHARTTPSAWDHLPWVQLLRTDPFYARLVNTYLLANALWVLVINTSFSNRFAYLSWFLMPWTLLYPFVPGRVIHRPRTGLIAATLVLQYMFTYFMYAVVYRLRGIQL